MDCVFCQIIAGNIPGEFVHQDSEVVAFRDIHPVAPIHILIVPRKHIPSLAELNDDESPLISHMISVANRLAKQGGVAEKGYRLVVNSGVDGGQLVPHLHLHLIGGRKLSHGLG